MITQNGHVIQTSLVSDFGDVQAGRIVLIFVMTLNALTETSCYAASR